jgi:hypothetical protein
MSIRYIPMNTDQRHHRVFYIRFVFRDRRHKTFEYSQENSQLKYLSHGMGQLWIISICANLSMRIISRVSIYSVPSISDSDIWVEISLENTQNFYDGGARCTIEIRH